MLKCDECGRWVEGRGKKCPYCGDSLRPEFKRHVREEITPGWKVSALAVAVLVGALIGCYAMWWASAHYSWDEAKSSTVSDKEDNEYTTFVPVRSGKVTILMPVYHDDNIIMCENGHTEMVTQSKYDKTSVGDNWNYTVTHYDWKPGMEGSPTPAWVYIAPVVVFLSILGVHLTRIAFLRFREMREFDRYGDTEIGRFKTRRPMPRARRI